MMLPQISTKRWLIYKIKNTVSGVAYVGLTSNLEVRIKRHKCNNTVGTTHFEIEILFDNIPTLREAREMEKVFIDKYDTFENGANKTRGGDGGGKTKPPKPQKYLSKGQHAQIVIENSADILLTPLNDDLTPEQRAQILIASLQENGSEKGKVKDAETD